MSRRKLISKPHNESTQTRHQPRRQRRSLKFNGIILTRPWKPCSCSCARNQTTLLCIICWLKSWRNCNCTVSRAWSRLRSEEHTSELQSHSELVCRLLLVKKKTNE